MWYLSYSCVRAGIPVSPMLAKPMKGISQILDRFEGKRCVFLFHTLIYASQIYH